MSITIIDKTAPPAPFFKRKPKPQNFKTSIERQRYWAKEKEYWVNGYNQDIGGMLYFYATQIKLKDRVTGDIDYPIVRDADVLIFSQLEESQKQGEAPFIFKGRGVGLSSIGMNLPFYFARVMPNSSTIATSKDKKTLSILFNEKTIVGYDELDQDIKFDLVNKNQTVSESFLKLGMKFIDKYGEEKYAQSTFTCRDTQESDKAATNFSGAGAAFCFADEAPLMPRFSKFFNSTKETLMDHSNNRMQGLFLSGGTMEDTIKTQEIQRIAEIYANSKILRIRPIFLPATYGKHMTNGHSDHKRAEREILERREELDKMHDKGDLRAYIKNNPLCIEDILDLGKGNSRFEDYTKERIDIQVKFLSNPTNTPNIVNHNLTEINNDIIAIPTPKGFASILEHPKPNVKYVLGLDATQSTEETSGSSGNSKFSLYVMKGIDPEADIQFAPVAKMCERPKDFDDIFDKGIRLLKYYNKFGLAKITGENNAAGGVFASKLLKDPILKKTVLAKRDLTLKGNVDTTKPFFYRNDDVLDWQFIVANTYFKKYAEQVKFLSLLKDCQLPDITNTDELDAFLGCLYGFGTGDLLGERPKEKAKKKVSIIVGYADGKAIWEDKFV
jgi:hypothetical protein